MHRGEDSNPSLHYTLSKNQVFPPAMQ